MERKDQFLVARLEEPCDCGSHIRHNNGGNYHEIKELRWNPISKNFNVWEASSYEDAKWEDHIVEDAEGHLQEWKASGDDLWINIEGLPALDIKKLRRRVRDALNKTGDESAIIMAALDLSVQLYV